MPQWIFWEDNISFVVFGAVYRPSSRVDYTERRKTERKNVSNEHYITGPPQREEILRERKMKRFLNFIKQNYTERRKTERKKENVSPLHHRATTERRNIKRNKNETVFKFYFWSMPQWSFFQTAGQLTFKTFQEFHSFLLISLLTKIIFRLSQKIHLLFLTIFPLN